ncbi:MAG: LamG domain-containing protein [Patescibacteria group bacterium]|jgi:hypothetical protein
MAGIDSFTKICLHNDGLDGGTTFVDSSLSAHTVTAIGTAQTDTDQYKFATASALLDGNSDGESVADSADFDLENYDMAIDFWVRFASLSGNQCFAGRPTSGTSYFYFAMEGGAIRLRDYNSGNILDLSFGSPSLSINTWYHFAITRDGNNFRFFIDGTQFGSTQTSSATFTNRSDAFQVGCNTVIGYFVNGWIDEFRLSIGNSRWTSNFTPETSAYTLDTLEAFSVDETVVWNDEFDWPQGTANYGRKIISINPLVFVSYESPAKITKVNVSDPENITWQAVEITGLDYAKGVCYNSNTGYIYVSGDGGKIAKIELANIYNQTIFNTGETDNLESIVVLEDFFRTFVNTDDVSGEIVMIDEATISSINTDLRILKQYQSILSTRLDIILGLFLNTDLRITSTVPKVISTDLRILQYAYNEVSQHPISDSDILIYINGVEVTQYNDVDMRSISIIYKENADITASMKLNRQHDKLNYTYSGVASEITNNNAIIITIKGITVFSGTIRTIPAESETESVTIEAIADEPDALFNSVTIPMATLNDDCHLYQCFMHNPTIDNPIVNTNAIITSNENQYWTGDEWSGNRKKALSFASFALAEAYILANAKLRGKLSQEVYPTNEDTNIEYYKGIYVNLGIRETQNIIRLSTFLNSTTLAEEVERGLFKAKSTWEYFWFGSATNFINGDSWATSHYIGSLGNLTNGPWIIDGLSYKYQKQLDNTYEDLGTYTLGSEPFFEIRPRNGALITKDRWEDKGDGLYRVKDEGYSYIQYAKDVADLEYAKLKNINGDLLPITSATIQLSLDGYFYYNIKLLTRINVSNTTTSNIYNGNNGFPVAVKSITINLSDMKVVLTCDNKLSIQEIQKIDDAYPDEDSDKYIYEAESVLNYQKYDLSVSAHIPVSGYSFETITRYGT